MIHTPPHILTVHDLRVSFQRPQWQVASDRSREDRWQPVVHGLSLEVEQGQIMAIVGESGSGKSVSALAMMRLLDHNPNARVQGRIALKVPPFHEQALDVSTACEETLAALRGHMISMVFQDARDALNPVHRIGRQLKEAITLHGGGKRTSKSQIHERVHELLRSVDLHDPERLIRSYPHQLSGGQRQRILIAMAVAHHPRLLIADEPTTALDPQTQHQVMETLIKLKEEQNLTLIFIDHNLALVRQVADTVLVMRNGQVVEQGPAQEILTNPSHPYTRLLVDATYPVDTPKISAKAPLVARTDQLSVQFHGAGWSRKRTLIALHPTSFDLQAGETLGIAGISGSGKTSLAMAVMQLIAHTGSVWVHGRCLEELSPKILRTWRRHVQMVFQDPFGSLSPRMTVADVISEGLRVHEPDWSPTDIDQEIVRIMTELALDPANRRLYPHEFSGGQRQRIAIARSLILNPRLLVLDEPTSSLDSVNTRDILQLLRTLQKKNHFAMLLISHQMAVLRAVCNRVIVLQQGSIVEHGRIDDVFDHPQHEATQRLLQRPASGEQT